MVHINKKGYIFLIIFPTFILFDTYLPHGGAETEKNGVSLHSLQVYVTEKSGGSLHSLQA